MTYQVTTNNTAATNKYPIFLVADKRSCRRLRSRSYRHIMPHLWVITVP